MDIDPSSIGISSTESVQKYSPSQPRDEQGRFAESGAVDAQASMNGTPTGGGIGKWLLDLFGRRLADSPRPDAPNRTTS